MSLSGALPPGLSFNAAAGTISGTPTQAGSYPNITVTASNGVNPNATQTFAITVNKAALTVTANNKIKTYGQANPPLTYTASGFVNGEDTSVLTGSLATTADASSAAGSYDITQGALDAANYAISFTKGALTVNKAILTVTADDKTRKVGTANPPLTVSYSGFVGGEKADVLDTTPTASTSADAQSAANTYDITVGGGSDNNYDFTYVKGTLTVTDKDIAVIAWADPTAITYGAKLGDAQLNATATFNDQPVAGTWSYSPAAGALLGAGSGQVLRVTFTPDDTANYAPVTAQAQIDVTRAPLTITAEDKTMVAGEALPALTARYSGFVGGEDAGALDTPLKLTTTATSASKPGSYDIVASEAADANYAITFVKGTLTVQAAAPSLATEGGDHGKAGSYFLLAGQNFGAGETVRIALDGRDVLTLTADANGALRFVLYFRPAAPARSYTVSATSAASGAQVAAASPAQAQVTIDPAAQLLARPADPALPQTNVLPTMYFPMAIQ